MGGGTPGNCIYKNGSDWVGGVAGPCGIHRRDALRPVCDGGHGVAPPQQARVVKAVPGVWGV